MSDLILRLVMSGLRKLLMGGGAGLVTAGVFDSDQLSQLVGAILTIVSLCWSGYQAWKDHKAINTKDLTGNTAPNVPVIDGGPLSPVQ